MSSPAAAPLPVGFRFRPTDEELVRHYLKPKIAGRAHPDLLIIPDVDLSACEPWELPAKALIRSDDPEWFFFAPLDRKYPGGHRSNRSTAAGYWKATGKDRLIRSRPAGALIGVKKTLVFHRGRAPRGTRTAWIMHEYRTTEPHLQQGQNGSFVLYRLFNKNEEEAPGSNPEDADSPSTSSPGNPPVLKSQNSAHLPTRVHNNEPTAPQEHDPLLDVLAQLPDLQPGNPPVLKSENSAHLPTPKNLTKRHPTDVHNNEPTAPQEHDPLLDVLAHHPDLQPGNPPVLKSQNSAHLPTHVHSNEPTAPQEHDPLLDVLAQLPDLQPDQTFDGFPTIASPMRPYTDHPFFGNVGGQDLSAYFNSIIAHQYVEEALSCTTGNAGTNPTAMLMPSSSSNDKVVNDMGAAHCSPGTKILQKDTGDVNHDTGAQDNSAYYSASAQLSHLYNQSQLHSNSAEMEPPYMSAQFSPGSWTPYPQQLFNDEPYSSDMTNSDAFDGLEGWSAEPMNQQLTDSNLLDPQQRTAARRIHLVDSVTKPVAVLPLHLKSEDEDGSSYSTGNIPTTHDKDYANLISETTAGEATHVQDGGLLPTQVVLSVEVTEKSRDFSYDEHISSNAKLPNEANLKQRLKKENTKTSENVRVGLEDSGRVPREPSYRTQQHEPIVASFVRLLCPALVVILAFVCLWKSSLRKYLN